MQDGCGRKMRGKIAAVQVPEGGMKETWQEKARGKRAGKGVNMFKAFLIKYAEIGVKGKNRHLFEDALVHQIKVALKRCEGKFFVHKTQGRIFVEAEGEFDFDETVGCLKQVFGINSKSSQVDAPADKADVYIDTGISIF